jgi:NTE family protein
MVIHKKNGSVRVAIACQGGGSHTAFTAGVLKRLLKEKDRKYEIVALSGTSGGAICALLAWYGMLMKDRNKASTLLDSFWMDNSVSSPWDMLLNDWIVWTSRLQGIVTLPEVSPYFYPPLAQEELRRLLEKHVEFDKISGLVNQESPTLLVGAVNVLSGEFKVFKNAEADVAAILASAAVPTFLRAVHIGNKVYWDGLFSQNPPLRDFVKGAGADAKPDEIWLIQIYNEKRSKEPESVINIRDRRNELAGNLSMNQEIDFIETVNKWVDKKYLPAGKYKHIEVRRIEMSYDLDTASKLDRSRWFIKDLMTCGESKAEHFLRQLP